MSDIPSNEIVIKPEIEITRRRLDIFVLVNRSRSMTGPKIDEVNRCIPQIITELKSMGKWMPNTDILFRCIAFSDSAKWHVGPDPANLNNITWIDITADSNPPHTDNAVRMLTEVIDRKNMPKRGYPPLMILISDGNNADGTDYEKSIADLNKEPWGTKAIRIALSVESYIDLKQLVMFSNVPKIGVTEIENGAELIGRIMNH